MKTSVFFGTLAAAGLAAGVATAGTLDDVKAKGFVQCGISTGVAGFAFTTASTTAVRLSSNFSLSKLTLPRGT